MILDRVESATLSGVALSTVPATIYQFELFGAAAPSSAVFYDSATDATGTVLARLGVSLAGDTDMDDMGGNQITARIGVWVVTTGASSVAAILIRTATQ